MKLKTLAAAILTSSALALTGCGGGSSSSSSSSGSTYTGAATQGDIASFTVNGTSLSYSLKGAHNPTGASGSLALQSAAGFPGFNWAQSGASTVGMMLSGNLGIGIVYGGTNPYTVVGLKNPSSDTTQITGKKFLYVQLSGTTPGFYEVTFNSNGGLTVHDPINNTTTTNNCWAASSAGTYFNALTGTTNCSAVNESSTNSNYYRFVIKPGTSRSGIVVDLADGTGFGIGLENKAFTPPTQDVTFSNLSFTPGNGNFTGNILNYMNAAKVTLKAAAAGATSTTIDVTPTTCSMSGGNVSCSAGTAIPTWGYAYFNRACITATATNPSSPATTGFSPEQAAYNGIVCVVENGDKDGNNIANEQFNVFYDENDGYYFAMKRSGGTIQIGSK